MRPRCSSLHSPRSPLVRLPVAETDLEFASCLHDLEIDSGVSLPHYQNAISTLPVWSNLGKVIPHSGTMSCTPGARAHKMSILHHPPLADLGQQGTKRVKKGKPSTKIYGTIGVTRANPIEVDKNGEGLGLGRAGTPVGVVVGMDTAVQHRTIPSIDDSRQATLCA